MGTGSKSSQNNGRIQGTTKEQPKQPEQAVKEISKEVENVNTEFDATNTQAQIELDDFKSDFAKNVIDGDVKAVTNYVNGLRNKTEKIKLKYKTITESRRSGIA